MGSLLLNHVTMTYGARVLFSEIDVEVAPGEILVVTGVNGSGKSTLLKIMSGLLRPESGSVHWGGPLGYAAPDVNVYAELTGRENLAFFAGLHGLPDSGELLLESVGLPLRRGRDLVGTYSSGMRQRLKLAVSLIGDPPLVIWDEPTLALDATGGNCVEEILERQRQRGGLAAVATNSRAEAERWGRGGIRLHLGRE